jgi:hypothetical protein
MWVAVFESLESATWRLVDQNSVSWNRIVLWMQQIDAVMRAA